MTSFPVFYLFAVYDVLSMLETMVLLLATLTVAYVTTDMDEKNESGQEENEDKPLELGIWNADGTFAGVTGDEATSLQRRNDANRLASSWLQSPIVREHYRRQRLSLSAQKRTFLDALLPADSWAGAGACAPD